MAEGGKSERAYPEQCCPMCGHSMRIASAIFSTTTTDEVTYRCDVCQTQVVIKVPGKN
jgi:predicted  nucleic acid-binding Zn ribbon protein